MKKILVTGGNGEFCKHLVEQGKDFSFLTPTKKEADIRHFWQLDRYFYQYQNDFDIVIHAAAVSDFYVKAKNGEKIKSGSELALELSPTTKILEKLRDLNEKMVLVGFKAEHDVSESVLLERASHLLESARADFIVANDVGKNAVFGSDDTAVSVVGKDGKSEEISGSKRDVAKMLLNHLL